jgi:hypothetical protein
MIFMKNIIMMLLSGVLVFASGNTRAQVYRSSATEALRNSGGAWVQKKLPPSLLTFSNYSGQVKIRAALSSLFIQNPDSLAVTQTPADTLADFTMTLDKEQIKQQQVSSGKTFMTTGLLVMNGINKKTAAQCQLVPRNNPQDGFIISVVIRFNPADFGMTMVGETANDPLIVRVTNGYLNKIESSLDYWK